MRRTAHRSGRTLLAALALLGLVGHAPLAHADPFAGASSIWSLLAPRARANTEISDVYRKKPLNQAETRMARSAPSPAPASSGGAAVRQ